MISLKNESEIKIMTEGGKILKTVFSELIKEVKVGVTTLSIDKKAEQLILSHGGESSFKKVRDYFWSTCISINEQVVHTPPSERIIKPGDVVTVDIGVFYKGFHTDFARTIAIPPVKSSTIEFLKAGETALDKAKAAAKAGGYVGDISKAIHDEIKKKGLFIIKELTGHGVGRELHEDPFVPGYPSGKISRSPLLKPGMTLALEVIYSKTTDKTIYEKGSDWSLVTADGSLSACFEDTVAILENKTLILT